MTSRTIVIYFQLQSFRMTAAATIRTYVDLTRGTGARLTQEPLMEQDHVDFIKTMR